MKNTFILLLLFFGSSAFAIDPIGLTVSEAEKAINPAVFIRDESESVRSYYKDDYVIFLASANGLIDAYTIYFPDKRIISEERALALLHLISGHRDWTYVEPAIPSRMKVSGYTTSADIIATIHKHKLLVAHPSYFSR